MIELGEEKQDIVAEWDASVGNKFCKTKQDPASTRYKVRTKSFKLSSDFHMYYLAYA